MRETIRVSQCMHTLCISLLKRNLLWIYFLPAVVLGFQKQESPGFVIQGTISYDSITDKSLVLITQTKEIMDTLRITDNSFSLKGVVNEPTYATLLINQKKFRFPLANDRIKIDIRSVRKNEFMVEYEESKIRDNLERYFKVDSEKYSDTYKNLIAESLNTKNDTERMMIEKRKDSLIVNFIDRCMSEYKRLKDNDGYAIIVYDLTNLFGTRSHPEKVEEFYKLLPTKLQEGFYGKKIRTYLNQFNQIEVGKRIDFKFFDIDNHEKTLKDYQGKYVLLEFWATWCGPCINLIPDLKRIYQSGKLEIISISIDEDLEKWKNKTPQLGMGWINIHFKQQDDLKDKFFVNGVPYNVLLSPSGTILKTNATLAELERLID